MYLMRFNTRTKLKISPEKRSSRVHDHSAAVQQCDKTIKNIMRFLGRQRPAPIVKIPRRLVKKYDATYKLIIIVAGAY